MLKWPDKNALPFILTFHDAFMGFREKRGEAYRKTKVYNTVLSSRERGRSKRSKVATVFGGKKTMHKVVFEDVLTLTKYFSPECPYYSFNE